ncbi:putative alpha/beta superfamily hydrolase [Kordia periserrulae]|uniref:Putative alpha/beta superfamily hydrolase n=1 Tax=Kordia periserrulae TaxID=701523 RepID=A0A2T6BVS0_9FLAO|nr:alpha/beta hydrolase-fold protein [Kordia periserrulae]PTX60174.1 putative alpha/beta superfamily hydrolase [Kordia periserrulae]
MKLKPTLLIIILLFLSCKGQKKDDNTDGKKSVTFVVTNLPENHNFSKDIYISGDFEGWSGGRPELKLEKKDSTYYKITLPNHRETINFKFTLGSWETVELDAQQQNIENRTYTFKEHPEMIQVTIGAWSDGSENEKISTKQANVETFAEKLEMPQLNTTRKIQVYLPPNYENSQASYPVVYMHDGQNVFDKATSYSGEWEVDETLNKLHETHGLEVIVVAIDNSEERMQEYTAWKHEKYGTPKGKEYVEFIAKTLKPAIDQKYRTKKDAQNTAIMGSSMGGLISHYAAFAHPDVFGKAGIFSPSFWFSEELFSFTKSHLVNANNSKLYYLMGEKEGEGMLENFNKMLSLLQTNNFPIKNYTAKFSPDGVHSETFWRSELKDALLFLFSDDIQKQPSDKPIAKEVTTAKLSAGKLMRVVDFPSQYIVPRNVDVWLPNNYSSDKKYKVLYMHDGQMLFDASTTWNKQEWKVDEVATKLMNEATVYEFIVVAPHNISEIRWQDYFPQKAFDYLSADVQKKFREEAEKNNFSLQFNADNYLKFLTEELKPYIDTTYSVKTKREHTYVAGSSMGGLISMYAMCEYPEVFGAAACISTHWVGARPMENNPLPEAFFAYMDVHLPSPKTHRFYFDYGTETLDKHYPQYAPKVDAVFKKKGYTKANFVNRKFEGTNHSENSWQQRLHIPLTFLLKN